MDLRQKTLAMLDSTRVEENYEITGNILVVVSLASMLKSNIYIWAEKDLHLYVRLFKSWDLHVHKVVCIFPKDFQKVDDIDIISPEDLLADATPNKLFFLDTPSYSINNLAEFQEKLRKCLQDGLIYYISSYDRTVLVSNHETFDFDKMFYYQSHKKEIMELFDSLIDYRSKLALYYYVESFVTNSVYKGEQISTRFKYFFGSKYEQLYKHLEGECWINCGANIGDTIFSYFSWDFKPRKIYAFEGNKKIFSTLLSTLSNLPADKRTLVEPINEMIDETTEFEKILGGNRCTLLNADIEGAELSLLKSMKKIIQADRPVMAVCVYHYKEDLLTIPRFIQSICPDYVYRFAP